MESFTFPLSPDAHVQTHTSDKRAAKGGNSFRYFPYERQRTVFMEKTVYPGTPIGNSPNKHTAFYFCFSCRFSERGNGEQFFFSLGAFGNAKPTLCTVHIRSHFYCSVRPPCSKKGEDKKTVRQKDLLLVSFLKPVVWATTKKEHLPYKKLGNRIDNMGVFSWLRK